MKRNNYLYLSLSHTHTHICEHNICILTTEIATHFKSNIVGSMEGSRIRPIVDDVTIAIDFDSDTDDSVDDDDRNTESMICRLRSGKSPKDRYRCARHCIRIINCYFCSSLKHHLCHT